MAFSSNEMADDKNCVPNIYDSSHVSQNYFSMF